MKDLRDLVHRFEFRFGFRLSGSGSRVSGSGFRDPVLGFSVSVLGFLGGWLERKPELDELGIRFVRKLVSQNDFLNTFCEMEAGTRTRRSRCSEAVTGVPRS